MPLAQSGICSPPRDVPSEPLLVVRKKQIQELKSYTAVILSDFLVILEPLAYRHSFWQRDMCQCHIFQKFKGDNVGVGTHLCADVGRNWYLGNAVQEIDFEGGAKLRR